MYVMKYYSAILAIINSNYWGCNLHRIRAHFLSIANFSHYLKICKRVATIVRVRHVSLYFIRIYAMQRTIRFPKWVAACSYYNHSHGTDSHFSAPIPNNPPSRFPLASRQNYPNLIIFRSLLLLNMYLVTPSQVLYYA